MEHNVYVFPPFALVRPLLRYFLDQCPSVSLLPPLSQILQAMAVDSYLLGRKGDPAVLLFPSRTCPDFIASILDKSPGQYCNIFLLFLGSLLKQCRVFEIFLQFSLPHPIQSWNSEKILDTRVQHCLWGEGRGWTCVNWKTPQKCKSVPRLLSMIVWKRGGKKKGNFEGFSSL